MLVIRQEVAAHLNAKDVTVELETAIAEKNLSKIKLLLQQRQILQLTCTLDLLSRAVVAEERLEAIHRQLELAEESKQEDALNLAVAMCADYDFFSEEVERVIQLKNSIVDYNKEAALALNICDLDSMRRVLQAAKAMGLHNNPYVSEIKRILFENSDLLQRHIQHMSALQLGDIALIIDRQIAFLDIKLMANRVLHDWKNYPDLKDPTAWASSKWTRRAERAAGFYRHTKDKPHECFTKLTGRLNQLALECFASIRIVMGDVIASNPMVEAEALLLKVYKYPELKEEVYLQLMKQLSGNSNPASITKGWKLFALCLRTFSSQKLEHAIFVFIRQNSISAPRLLRLLFYSIVAIRPKKPTLEYVTGTFE